MVHYEISPESDNPMEMLSRILGVEGRVKIVLVEEANPGIEDQEFSWLLQVETVTQRAAVFDLVDSVVIAAGTEIRPQLLSIPDGDFFGEVFDLAGGSHSLIGYKDLTIRLQVDRALDRAITS